MRDNNIDNQEDTHMAIPSFDTKAVSRIDTDRFITLQDLHLHYVDWGGTGKPLLFLPGLGDTAHIFDELAPEFTGAFRCLGLTRRGQGLSDKPEQGYQSAVLAGDIRAFLDALGLPRATLVGHSLAGMEMTHFAGLYPERVDRLVYLDAAFDQSTRTDRPVEGAIDPDRSSLDTVREWSKLGMEYWSETLETNLRQATYLGEDGSVQDQTSDAVAARLMQGAMSSPLDYSRVTAPALGIFGMSTRFAKTLEGKMAEGLRPAFRDWMAQVDAWKQGQVERFRTELAGSRVVVIPEAGHYVFLAHRAEVVREMMAFLSET